MIPETPSCLISPNDLKTPEYFIHNPLPTKHQHATLASSGQTLQDFILTHTNSSATLQFVHISNSVENSFPVKGNQVKLSNNINPVVVPVSDLHPAPVVQSAPLTSSAPLSTVVSVVTVSAPVSSLPSVSSAPKFDTFAPVKKTSVAEKRLPEFSSPPRTNSTPVSPSPSPSRWAGGNWSNSPAPSSLPHPFDTREDLRPLTDSFSEQLNFINQLSDHSSQLAAQQQSNPKTAKRQLIYGSKSKEISSSPKCSEDVENFKTKNPPLRSSAGEVHNSYRSPKPRQSKRNSYPPTPQAESPLFHQQTSHQNVPLLPLPASNQHARPPQGNSAHQSFYQSHSKSASSFCPPYTSGFGSLTSTIPLSTSSPPGLLGESSSPASTALPHDLNFMSNEIKKLLNIHH